MSMYETLMDEMKSAMKAKDMVAGKLVSRLVGAALP